MISGRICRIYVSDEDETPAGYTRAFSLLNLVGLKSPNIHIHLGKGWDHADGDRAQELLQNVIVNLSCNSQPPLITIGQFDPRLSKMLFSMEILGV